jgi:hypothetical protein
MSDQGGEVRNLLCIFLLVLSALALGQENLTNDSILKMVKSGLDESLIVRVIQSQPGTYSLTTDEIRRLKQGGVSETILTAMAAKAADSRPSDSVKIELKTPVRLTVDETLSSKNAKPGDTFKLSAAEAVSINGQVIIAKGAPSTGRIIAAQKRSLTAHNGRLEVAVDSVQAVDGHHVPLDGRLEIGGGGVGFARTGKDAQIEKGQIINAVVAAETNITLEPQ